MIFLLYAVLFTVVQIQGQRICQHNGLVYLSQDAMPILCDVDGGTQKALYGDFNGDGRTDWFCKHLDGTAPDRFAIATKAGTFYKITELKATEWCSQGILMIGDFDGDKRDDLLCRYNDGTRFEVSYFDGRHFSSPMKMFTSMKCPLSTHTFLIGDVDADMTMDFICAERSSGTITLQYNYRHRRGRRYSGYNSHRRPYVWSSPGFYTVKKPFCIGSNKQLVLADFDNDRRQDLACHDPTSSDLAISFAHGKFRKSQTFPLGAGGFCSTTPNTVVAADVDGNHYTDLICLTDSSVTDELVLFNAHNQGIQEFSSRTMTVNSLPFARADIGIGDFNGDGLADMAWHNTADQMEIRFATCNS